MPQFAVLVYLGKKTYNYLTKFSTMTTQDAVGTHRQVTKTDRERERRIQGLPKAPIF